jgi:L-Lysine epsilon oxidase N-terminal
MPIATVKIHPAIGIARIGNSPTDFFIGPEIPLDHRIPLGGYKDASCRVKRQAARFRLFGYDQNGNLVQELTAADSEGYARVAIRAAVCERSPRDKA